MSDSASPHLPPNVVVFGPKANCTLEICPVQFSVYGYRPSLAANGAFIGLYIIAMIVHAYLGFIRWKTPWFAGCMVVGAINAIIGYTGRVMMYYNPFDFAAFMMQICEYTDSMDHLLISSSLTPACHASSVCHYRPSVLLCSNLCYSGWRVSYKMAKFLSPISWLAVIDLRYNLIMYIP
jgi:hypothetical protein